MSNCDHKGDKRIIVLHAFAMVEVIGIKCDDCEEIIEVKKQ